MALYTVWFVLIAVMVALYVVLDGFDLGAGALHLTLARTNAERRQILRAIGPVWDGNEVWIIAAGGALFCAFPALYAASFSGLYLPLFVVLWLLILRAVAIEFHHRVHHLLWTQFWDAVFCLASLVLIVFLGVALGNVVRGVPLDHAGFFAEPLWTSFSPHDSHPGVLDWYTIAIGLLAFSTLCVHGATFLALKTDGAVQQRARQQGRRFWIVTIILTILDTVLTLNVREHLLANYQTHPALFVFPLLAIVGLIVVGYALNQQRDGWAFGGSVAYILGMLTTTVFSLYPMVLPAINPANSLTVTNASTSTYGLSVALHWWVPAMILTACYFIFLYWLYRGKVSLPESDTGY